MGLVFLPKLNYTGELFRVCVLVLPRCRVIARIFYLNMISIYILIFPYSIM